MTVFQEQGLNKLVECMALNSASTSSESESEVSEVKKVFSLLVRCFLLYYLNEVKQDLKPCKVRCWINSKLKANRILGSHVLFNLYS